MRSSKQKEDSAGAKRQPIYRAIFEDFFFAITSGVYQPDQKLPSVRTTSERYGVSVPTVLQAYIDLESQGMVEARERSGFYVLNRERRDELGLSPDTGVDEPMPPELGRMVRRIFNSAYLKNAVSIGFDAPSVELYPIRKLNSIIAAICRKRGQAVHEYSDISGLPALRQIIARRLLADGCQLHPDEIVVTSGGQEALNLSLRAVCQPGDIVVVEYPTYYGILLAAETLGLKVIELPSDPRSGLRIEALEHLLESDRVNVGAVVVMPNVGSPTGSLMPDEGKRRLIELCLERSIPLIEDDTNRELYYGTARPSPLRALDHSGNTILCCSFSKTISPGLRVGFAAPGRFLERTLDMKFCTSIYTPTLFQLATTEYVSSRAYERHLKRLRGAFKSQMTSLISTISQHWPDGVETYEPHGGNFLWLKLPQGVDSLSLHDAALREQIKIAPGVMFAARSDLRQFMRLSAGQVWSDKVERSVIKLGKIVEAEIGKAGSR